MMAATLKLIQGTPEWAQYRQGMRNASETSAVLGLSPWLTPYGLWMLKTGRSKQEATPPMLHGTRMEPEARAAYEMHTGHMMKPLVLQDGPYSASLDGITLDGELIVEIKCPFRGKRSSLWQDAEAGRVPNHYAVQVQHQLMVSGAQLAHVWVFAEGDGILITLRRDVELMAVIRDGWDDFQRYLDTDMPPPLTDADAVKRDDPAWTEAALAYLDAKQRSDVADKALEVARKGLLGLVRSPREVGAGVSVVKLWKAGNVDYKSIPELRGVNLDRYRGAGREEARITVAKT